MTESRTEPERFGRYEVLDYLAEGGMGVVLKARDPDLDRVIALKVLSPKDPDDDLAEVRFVREAKVAAQLDHPNVAHIYEVGEESGTRYIAMEYVEGQTLEDMVEIDGPLAPEEALSLVDQVACGLAAAAELNLVHRDIKPGNIMVTPSGKVKIVDFGLARRLMENTPSTITAANEILGTPDFIAPEQAQNLPVDHRTDLYSLGISLYFALAGRPPFENEDTLAAIISHIRDPLPDVRLIVPELSDAVTELVERLCEKEPADRYQTYPELRGEIRRILEEGSATDDPTRPIRDRRAEARQKARAGRRYTRALALLLLLALTALVYQNQNRPLAENAPILLPRRVGNMERSTSQGTPVGWEVRGTGGNVVVERDQGAAAGRGFVRVRLETDLGVGESIALVRTMRRDPSLEGKTLVLLLRCRVGSRAQLRVQLRALPTGEIVDMGVIPGQAERQPTAWTPVNLAHDLAGISGIESLELVLGIHGGRGASVDLDTVSLQAY